MNADAMAMDELYLLQYHSRHICQVEEKDSEIEKDSNFLELEEEGILTLPADSQ